MEDTHFIDKEPNRYEALAELQKQQIQSMNEERVVNLIEKFESAWDLRTGDYRNARELPNWKVNSHPFLRDLTLSKTPKHFLQSASHFVRT